MTSVEAPKKRTVLLAEDDRSRADCGTVVARLVRHTVALKVKDAGASSEPAS
jgi:hypothetical protein